MKKTNTDAHVADATDADAPVVDATDADTTVIAATVDTDANDKMPDADATNDVNEFDALQKASSCLLYGYRMCLWKMGTQMEICDIAYAAGYNAACSRGYTGTEATFKDKCYLLWKADCDVLCKAWDDAEKAKNDAEKAKKTMNQGDPDYDKAMIALQETAFKVGAYLYLNGSKIAQFEAIEVTTAKEAIDKCKRNCKAAWTLGYETALKAGYTGTEKNFKDKYDAFFRYKQITMASKLPSKQP